MLSVVGKIYEVILLDSVHKVTEGLTDDERGGFRARSGCVDQIFTQKQIGEKTWEKNIWVLWTWRRHMIGLIGKHYGSTANV